MDGVHDLGGMDGFGPVAVEPEEPVFHHEWERRALGITFGFFGSGLSNGGRFRHSIERMDPAHYLGSRYYEHWATGVATLFVEAGVVTVEELEERAGGAFPLSLPGEARAVTVTSSPGDRPRFAVGDAVRVADRHPRGHTRCPRYVRGRTGTVVRVDGSFSLPDVEAHADERQVEPTYSVRFESRDLWGGAEADAAVHVDLWESWLAPAPAP